MLDHLARAGFDPEALVEAALARAAAAPGVFIALRGDDARAEAAAAALRRRAGRPLGPLDGLPVAWKDMIDIAGTITTAGSRLQRDPAAADAPVVAATRALGLIPLGKTNLSEFAFSGLGLNPHYGTPVPDRPGPARVPGGSSSGSAIAVQRGIVPAAIGTDTAGSIRVPAGFNGLVGFRPSLGRYPAGGMTALAPSFDTAGPIARSVRCCRWLDAAMRGRMPGDDLAMPGFVADSTVLDDPALMPSQRDNLLAALDRLRAAGATVTIEPVPAVSAAREAIARHGWPGSAEALARYRDVLAGPQCALVDPRVVARLEAARTIVPVAARVPLDDRVLVLPTTWTTAPPLAPLEADAALFAAVNLATLALTMIGSFLKAPGLALPTGADADGQPTSLTLMLPPGQDDRLLAAGAWVESILTSGNHDDA